jgi:hypothetical protein
MANITVLNIPDDQQWDLHDPLEHGTFSESIIYLPGRSLRIFIPTGRRGGDMPRA